MAWWMYRARNLPAAADQLEQARQEFPDSLETFILQAWVMSDLGRRADAETSLHHPTDPKHSAEYLAAQAVIQWRTGDTQDAKLRFQQAAHDDAVWMVPRWVQNNYSASAAGVIRQLQAQESARSLKEMQERLHAAAAAAKQTQPQQWRQSPLPLVVAGGHPHTDVSASCSRRCSPHTHARGYCSRPWSPHTCIWDFRSRRWSPHLRVGLLQLPVGAHSSVLRVGFLTYDSTP